MKRVFVERLTRKEEKAPWDIQSPWSLSYGHLLETPFHASSKNYRLCFVGLKND